MEQEPKTPREQAEDLIRLLVPDWRPTPQQILWVIRIAIVLGFLIAIGYAYGITLWQWAKLLIVPAVIAAGGLWFNQQQQERQREDDRGQHERGLEIENQRAQDEALQTYLDQIGQLLLDKDSPLRKSTEGDEVRTLARARTLTVLARLDGRRKSSAVQFLYESGLIAKDTSIVDLTGANLWYANLEKADLREADLREADLSGADLSVTNLSGANVCGANLSGADLRGANLFGAWGFYPLEGGAKYLEGAMLPDGRKYGELGARPIKSTGRSSSS